MDDNLEADEKSGTSSNPSRQLYKKRRKFITAVGCGSLLTLTGCIGAEEDDVDDVDDVDDADDDDFPSETIRMVVGAAEGGGNDLYARIFAEAMEEVLDVPVSVENHPGAGYWRAYAETFHSPPNGYHITVSSPPITGVPSYVIDPEDAVLPLDEFEPVANMAMSPYGLFVSPDTGLTEGDYEDLINNYQTGEWVDMATQLSVSPLALAARVSHGYDWENMLVYHSGAEIAAAASSGEAPTGLVTGAPTVPVVGGGDLVPVVCLHSNGFAMYPEVPTATDLGYENIDPVAAIARGWLAPPGTPTDRINILADAFKQAAETDTVKEWSEETGNPVDVGGPEVMRDLFHGAIEELPDLVDIDELEEIMG